MQQGQVMHPHVDTIIHAGIAASGAFKGILRTQCVLCDGILLETDNTHLREQFDVE